MNYSPNKNKIDHPKCSEEVIETNKNDISPALLALGASFSLTACGSSDKTKLNSDPKDDPDTKNRLITKVANKTDAARFLQQATFSSTEEEINVLMPANLDQWIDYQETIKGETTAWDWLLSHNYADEHFRNRNYPAMYALWHQLFTGEDVLRKRIALALSEIFVINLQAMKGYFQHFTYVAFWDLLNKHAFGNYRDLLEAVSLNPAMGVFLSTKGNKKADGKGREPDENYARKILQLFSIGLFELNEDGSIKKDESGNPINTYDQDDIVNLARVFTGWAFRFNDADRKPDNSDDQRNPMTVNDVFHSPEQKKFLNVVIPADTDGKTSLKIALDTIFNHPNVGPFMGKLLIQRLVKSNPSPDYIKAVTQVFNDNGDGVRGDLKAVIKTILLHPEARLNVESNDGKIREPMLRFIQWARTFNVQSRSGKFLLKALSSPESGLAQSPMAAPSVFNFFRPGYVPPNTALSALNKTAPELQIVNEVSVAGYINYMQGLIERGDGKKDEEDIHDIQGDYSNYYELAKNPSALVAKLNLELTANQLSQYAIDLIVEGISDIGEGKANWQEYRAKAAIIMIMSSPNYIAAK